MENTYGIGVTNRYALFLDEEEDPLEVLKRQEQERETKRKSKNLDKETKSKNAEPKQATIRKVAKDNQNAKVASTKSAETAKSKDEIANTKGVHQKNVKFLGDSREDRNNRRNRDQTLSDSISRDAAHEGQGRGPRSNTTIGTRDGPREGFGRGFRHDITSGLREGQSRGPRNDMAGGLREGQSRGPRYDMARGLREGQSRGPRNDMTGGLREGQSRGPRNDTTGGLREGQSRGPRNDMVGNLRDGPSRGPRNDMFGEDRRGRGMGPRGGARGRSYRGIPVNRASYDIRLKRDFDRPFGSDKTEQQLSTKVPSNEWETEPPAFTEVVADEAIMAPAVTEPVENPVAAEEEPHELTLDEYKALRGSRQKPTYNLRKAGEGEDLTQWNNMYVLSKKKEEEEPDEEEATEYDVLEYPQRVGRQKHLLNIDIHFTDGRRGSRSRGGRGGSRGSRGSGPRGGGTGPRPDDAARAPRGRGDCQGPAIRGERGMRFMSERGFRAERGEHSESYGSRGAKQSAPKVDDEHDFPSLG